MILQFRKLQYENIEWISALLQTSQYTLMIPEFWVKY